METKVVRTVDEIGRGENDCGPIALRTVAYWYNNRTITQEESYKICSFNGNGLESPGLARALHSINIPFQWLTDVTKFMIKLLLDSQFNSNTPNFENSKYCLSYKLYNRVDDLWLESLQSHLNNGGISIVEVNAHVILNEMYSLSDDKKWNLFQGGHYLTVYKIDPDYVFTNEDTPVNKIPRDLFIRSFNYHTCSKSIFLI